MTSDVVKSNRPALTKETKTVAKQVEKASTATARLIFEKSLRQNSTALSGYLEVRKSENKN